MRLPAAIMAGMALAVFPSQGAEDVPLIAGKRQVEIQQVGKEVTIIGRLGAPLGKRVSVTATYNPKARDSQDRWGNMDVPVIRVTKVNGRDLPQPVNIHPDPGPGKKVEFPVGHPFECQGREMGGFYNNSDSFPSPQQSAGKFGFYTSFQVVEAPEFEDPGIVASPKTIKADEIGKKIDLVGRLGVALGKEMTLTAVYDPTLQAPKEESTASPLQVLVLRVTKVDGISLSAPVKIKAVQWNGTDSPQAYAINTPFQCRGCEVCGAMSEAFCGAYAQWSSDTSTSDTVIMLSKRSSE